MLHDSVQVDLRHREIEFTKAYLSRRETFPPARLPEPRPLTSPNEPTASPLPTARPVFGPQALSRNEPNLGLRQSERSDSDQTFLVLLAI